jgi:hypothetical protein
MATTSATQWLRTTALLKQLALGRNQLFQLKAAGVFKPGEHYRQNGTSAKAPLVWDLAAVDQTLRQLATKA